MKGMWPKMNFWVSPPNHHLFLLYQRDLPLCLGISMTVVTGCYVLVNVAYIAVLGKAGILGSSAVALVSLLPFCVPAYTFDTCGKCMFHL